MSLAFIRSFQSERIKTKRSLATWIVVIGGFFTPGIVTTIRLVQYETLPTVYASDKFWMALWENSWESMAIFLLPMGIVLTTSLITQIEYKNNTWKQLHTTPLSLTTIFFSKLSVIVVMMFQFFVLFNIGIYLSAVIPYLLISDVPYPKAPFPYLYFLDQNLFYFIDCLPIIALQYLISLQYKNFLVPVGAGFVFWVGSLGALTWKYGYIIPYTYCAYHYLQSGVENKATIPSFNYHWLALGYFVVITVVSFVLYVTRKEKG